MGTRDGSSLAFSPLIGVSVGQLWVLWSAGAAVEKIPGDRHGNAPATECISWRP